MSFVEATIVTEAHEIEPAPTDIYLTILSAVDAFIVIPFVTVKEFEFAIARYVNVPPEAIVNEAQVAEELME